MPTASFVFLFENNREEIVLVCIIRTFLPNVRVLFGIESRGFRLFLFFPILDKDLRQLI